MGEPFYHDVILNRLGVYQRHNGRDVYYSPESFSDTDAWSRIPVIYAPSTGEDIDHPDHDAVRNGMIAEPYRRVGYVEYAYIPYEGESRLAAVLAIEDAEVEQQARDGLLAISSGFEAGHILMDNGTVIIAGTIRPNHVLVFPRGVCPNCWPNDNGSMFLNTTEEGKPTAAPIDNETRGKIHQLWDRICNTKQNPEPAEPTNNTTMTEDTPNGAELEQLRAEIEQLRAENARHQAEAEARKRDETWNNIKAAVELPAGWLGDREPETRALYENNKDLFFVQLIQHNAKLPHNNTAQGKCTCGTLDNVAETKNALEEVRKSTGFCVKMEEE